MPQRDIFAVSARALIPLVVSLCVLWGAAALASGAAPTVQEDLLNGAQARALGNIVESITVLERAVRRSTTPAERVHALTELGLSLAQSGRVADADAALQAAYREAGDGPRFSIALALGNVALRTHDTERARHFYEAVVASDGHGEPAEQAKLSAELNLARLQPPLERLQVLEPLLPRVEAIRDPGYRAHALFSVGQLAGDILEPLQIARPDDFDRALRLSYHSLAASRQMAQASGDGPLAVDAGDALAQLYESQERWSDASSLNRRVLAEAAHLPLSQAEFPLVRLEWRAARLQQRAGADADALGSLLRAAQHLESIRQDLPIEDARGRSTYQTLQRPIYAGLLNRLLDGVDRLGPEARQARLTAALNSVEFAHQAELQDYLGDRCAVETTRASASTGLESGVAIVYPIIIRDRLEVLVRTNDGVLHRAAPVSAAELGETIRNFRAALLDPESNDFLGDSHRLYDWLIQPFSDALAAAHVHALVIVPDGVLRLIPFAVLNDGNQFLAQRYWLSTVTGLTMTESHAGLATHPVSLLAGLSTPGPVVDRLIAMGFTGNPAPTNATTARGLTRSVVAPGAAVTAPPLGTAPAALAAARTVTLRGELELPGAKTEIQELAPLAHGVRLLDGDFTVARFEREVQSGDYNVVHVASHGFFGDSVGESFLLAYDNVIRIDELQKLIAIHGAQQPGIDLLTLSACDTATGDDRAPLGFAGAGIKARARSVVGSLWAVSDAATQQFMGLFYANLPQHGKAEAFTRAQRSLMQSAEFAHPYYWAPFILTGDWN